MFGAPTPNIQSLSSRRNRSMTYREAFLAVALMTLTLAIGLALAGIVSELAAPTIQTEIGDAWSQAPR